MMKKNALLVLTILFLSFFLSGCNQPAKIDFAEVLSKSEKEFKESGIECVSAFDGKLVKFRLLLEEQPTDEEATKYFEKILDTIATYSNNPDTWDFYNAEFDLVYEEIVIYEGKKEAGKDLKVNEI